MSASIDYVGVKIHLNVICHKAEMSTKNSLEKSCLPLWVQVHYSESRWLYLLPQGEMRFGCLGSFQGKVSQLEDQEDYWIRSIEAEQLAGAWEKWWEGQQCMHHDVTSRTKWTCHVTLAISENSVVLCSQHTRAICRSVPQQIHGAKS